MKLHRKNGTRAVRAVRAAAWTVVCCGSVARAGVSFNGANVKITHDPNTGAVTTDGTIFIKPMPLSGVMPTYNYGLATLSGGGSGTSTADASVGAISNSTTVGYTLKSGTGVSQSDTGNSMTGYADLKMVVDGTWTATAPSFGPTATGYVSFSLAGSVGPGAGDFAKAIVNLSWTNLAKTINYRAPFVQTYNFTNPGSFGTVVLNSLTLNSGSLTTGTQIRISGTIELQAQDPGTSTITPADFEASAAPPTAIFDPTQIDTTWNAATNWTSDMINGAVPRSAGNRAKFGENSSAQNVALDIPIVLGTLDFDDSHGVSINAQAANQLTFDTEAGNAVVFARNAMGDGAHAINSNVVLNKDLEVINDSAGALTFNGVVSGSGGLIKDGLGTAVLGGGSPNAYTGATLINGGFVDANKAGAISSSSVHVSNAVLNYNVNGAVAGSTVTQVDANGEVNLGVNPAGSDIFSVNSGGGIRGSGGELSNLTVGGNVSLAAGAMIVHESFDAGPANNPGGLFTAPVTPTVIFGIGTDFTGGTQAIDVGSGSNSPWVGFGGDRGIRTFGANNTDTTHTIAVWGNAQLVSLGGEMVLNGQLNSAAGGVPSITKRGAGVVSLNNTNNGFDGAVDVQEGLLAVNGNLSSTAGIQVQPHATIGGKGIIAGAVQLIADVSGDGGHLAPGAANPSFFAPPPFTNNAGTVGTLTATSLIMGDDAQLDYDLNTADIVGAGINDLLVLGGSLTLDGFLNITGGLDFDEGTYTLIQFGGSITDNGLEIGIAPSDYNYNIEITNNPSGPGQVVLLHAEAVPEPGTIAWLGLAGVALSRKRRSARLR